MPEHAVDLDTDIVVALCALACRPMLKLPESCIPRNCSAGDIGNQNLNSAKLLVFREAMQSREQFSKGHRDSAARLCSACPVRL
jgi:hypothetical protein